MLAWTALALLAQSPPVAATDSPPPPVVTVPHKPGPPSLAVPAPPRPAPSPPEARRDPQQLILADDYPASALAERRQGTVAFTLDVGPDGRVHGCTITRSSGSSALDSATCAIMRRRARFTPAIDSRGMPVAGRVEQEVEWRLPEEGERG